MSDTTASRRQKINNAGDLQSVVCSMKAWAAASVGQYEKAMSALADYHRTVEPGLGVCFRGTGSAALMTGETRRADAGAIDAIVFGSDQGLVVQFNDVVADYAINTLAVLSGKTTAHVLVCPVVGWSSLSASCRRSDSGLGAATKRTLHQESKRTLFTLSTDKTVSDAATALRK